MARPSSDQDILRKAAFAAAVLCFQVSLAAAQVLEIGDDGVARRIGGGWSAPGSPAIVNAGTSSFRAAIEAAAAATGLSPHLIETVARTESGLDPGAVSPAGAVGLMQLMPGTPRTLGVDPKDPAQNLMGGARYLRVQIDRFDGALDLAAYNAGPARAGDHPAFWSPELIGRPYPGAEPQATAAPLRRIAP